MRKIATIICLIVSLQLSGQICTGSFTFQETELFPENPNLLLLEDILSFDQYELMFSDEVYEVSSYSEQVFNSKHELVDILGCFYDFESDTELIYGTVIQVSWKASLEIGFDRFSFIEYFDCGRRRNLLLTPFGVYSCRYKVEIDRITDSLKTIIKKPASFRHEYYVTSIDTSGFVELILPTEYETVTEQVLVKDRHQVLSVTPTTFDTSYIEYYSSSSVCPEAIIKYDTLLHKEVEAYSTYEILSAEFELVSEYVPGYTAEESNYFYKREWKEQNVLLKEQAVSYSIEGLKGAPKGNYFFDHIALDSIVIPARDTFIGSYLELCPDGFKAAGLYCYKENPTLFSGKVKREFLNLKTPATATVLSVEAQQSQIILSKVINLEEIDMACVKLDTQVFRKVQIMSPAKVDSQTVPAEYKINSYELPLEPPQLIVTAGDNEFTVIKTEYPETEIIRNVKVNMPENFGACHRRVLYKELFRRGYLAGLNPSTTEFYQAILDYQSDAQDNLGIIDVYLLARLR